MRYTYRERLLKSTYTGQQIISMLKRVCRKFWKEGKVLSVPWWPSDRDPRCKEAGARRWQESVPLFCCWDCLSGRVPSGNRLDPEAGCPCNWTRHCLQDWEAQQRWPWRTTRPTGGRRRAAQVPLPSWPPLLCPLSWAESHWPNPDPAWGHGHLLTQPRNTVPQGPEPGVRQTGMWRTSHQVLRK